MPTTTAVFRAVADFASLNRQVSRTRKELAGLQAQAKDTSSWDAFDTAIGKVTASQERLAEANRKQARADRAAIKAADAHTAALDRETAAVSEKVTALDRFATALDNVASRERAASGAADRHAAAMEAESSSAHEAASAERERASATSASGSAADDAASSTDRFTDAVDRATRSSQRSSRGAYNAAQAYRDFSAGARAATASGGALRSVLLGLGVPAVIIGVQTLGAALSSLIGGLIAVVGAAAPATGALAAIGPAALTAAGAIGTVMLALRGVGDALKAASAVEEQSAQTAQAAAKRRVAAARSIENAQYSLQQAQEAAARAAENAADAVIAADARLVDANEEVLRVEQELHAARRQAIRDLQDLAEQVSDNALTVEGAEIGLLRAQERQRDVNADASSTALDRREAALRVAQAEDRLSDAKRRSAEDQAALNKAEQRGVEGAPVVVEAKRRLADAEEARREAADAVADAVREQTRVQEDSAQRIARAQLVLQRALDDAAASQNEASAASRKYAQAMAALSPAGRQFVNFLRSLLPLIQDLSHVAQQALFPGLTRALRTLTPMIRSVAIPVVTAFGHTLGRLAEASAETFLSWESDLLSFGTGPGPRILDKVGRAALAIADAFRHIGVAAVPLTEWLADLVLQFGQYLQRTTAAARESGRLARFFDQVKDTLKLLGNILRNVSSILFSTFKAAAPMGRRLLRVFRDLTKETADYLKTAEGQRKLTGYFDALEPNIRLTLKLLGDLALAFARLGASEGATKVLQAIDENLAPALSRLAAALGRVTAKVGPQFIDLLADFADALTRLLDAGGGAFFEAFVGVLDTFADVLKFLLGIPGVGQLGAVLLAIAGGMKAIKAVGAITGLAGFAGGLNRVAGGAMAARAGERPARGFAPATTFVGGLSRGVTGKPTSGRIGPGGIRASGAPTATARAGAAVGSVIGAPVRAARQRRLARQAAPPMGRGPGAAAAPVLGRTRRVGGAVGRGALAAGRVVGGGVAPIAGAIGGSMAGAAIGQRVGGDTGAMVGSIAGSVAGGAAPQAIAAGIARIGPAVDAAKKKLGGLATQLTSAVAGAARAAGGALASMAMRAGQAALSMGGVIAAWFRAGVAATVSGAKQAAAWVAAKGRAAAGLITALAQAAAGYVRLGVQAALSATRQLVAAAAARVVRGVLLAWAAAQWLLNAAMTANPIGILIAIIVALVAAFIYAWKNSETFRNIVKGAIDGIVAAFKWMWNTIIKPILDALVWYFKNILAPVYIWLWKNIVKPALEGIGAALKWVWNKILKPIFDALVWLLKNVVAPAFTWLWRNIIKPALDGIGALVQWVWRNLIKPGFDAIVGGLKWLGSWFNTIVDGIKRAWDRLIDIFKRPINFLINTVWNNGLLVAWNRIAGWIPGLPKAQKLRPLATGGEVPGTGNRDSVPAILTPGEYVLSKPVVEKWGLENIDAAHQAARKGGHGKGSPEGLLSGYAVGGAVDRAMEWANRQVGKTYVYGGKGPNVWDCSSYMSGIAKMLLGQSPGGHAFTTSSFAGGRGAFGFRPGLKSSFGIGVDPGSHMAGTLAGRNFEATPPRVRAGGAARGAHYGRYSFHLPEAGGRFIGGGGGGDSWYNPIPGWVRSAVKSIVDPLINRMPDPPPQFLGIPKNFAKMVRDKALDFFLGEAGTAGAAPGAGGPAQEQVRAVANRYGWGTGPEWNAIVELVRRESSWNPQAANPRSSARGLFQKMTSIHGPVEPTAAGQAEWGLRYIRERYGTPTAALRHHDRNNWYGQGGPVVLPQGFGSGGLVPGSGADSVPAMLSPGEFVLNKDSVQRIGVAALRALNSGFATTSTSDDVWRRRIAEWQELLERHGQMVRVTEADVEQFVSDLSAMFSPVQDALASFGPALSASRAGMVQAEDGSWVPRSFYSKTSPNYTANRDINVQFDVYNPIPEPASDTAARKMRTLALMGAFT